MKNILMIFGLLVAVFVVVVALQPDDFRISRSSVISAPPQKVFDQVNDFHNWAAWSPWAAMDPNSKISYEGASSGVGAVFKWAGNNQVGEGSNTIVESRPGELITIRLDFIKPFPGTSSAEFTFKPEGAGTMVTWSMSGKNNFIGKAMSLVMNCDKMVGGQFEKGLAGLKQVSEAK